MRAGARGARARLWAALGLALWPRAAGATWSIAAVDPATREVGVAVASCIEAPHGSEIVPFVAGLAPGRGALAAQALYDRALRDHALALLLRGAEPRTVIEALAAVDPQQSTRQYGVALLDLRTAAFTGAQAQPWAGHRQGRGVTVQGNLLRGPEVVEAALAAFEAEPTGCPPTLADRLMLALEAGAARGGDGRCGAEQAALAAALRVAAPGDDPEAPTLDLRIPSQPAGGDAPVALLRSAYDAWRREHPPDASRCPTREHDDAPTRTTAAGSRIDRPRSAHELAPPDAAAPADATVAAGGCGCRPGPVRVPHGALLLLLALLVPRRASRARATTSCVGSVVPASRLTRSAPRAVRPVVAPLARKRPAPGHDA